MVCNSIDNNNTLVNIHNEIQKYLETHYILLC